MTYDDPRTAAIRYPVYAEDHCALRWPLLLFGVAFPALAVALFVLAVITKDIGLVLPIMALLIVTVATGGRYVGLNWPTGIRLDGAGVRIGRVRHAERHPNRKPRKKLPVPAGQCWQVFSCNWDGVKSISVVTDRETLRQLRKTVRRAPTGGSTGRVRATAGGSQGYALGMLIPPYMRAALVVRVDPWVAHFPEFRPLQGLAVQTSQWGTRSSVWVVPTRHPDRLQAALAAAPLSATQAPPPDRATIADWQA